MSTETEQIIYLLSRAQYTPLALNVIFMSIGILSPLLSSSLCSELSLGVVVY